MRLRRSILPPAGRQEVPGATSTSSSLPIATTAGSRRRRRWLSRRRRAPSGIRMSGRGATACIQVHHRRTRNAGTWWRAGRPMDLWPELSDDGTGGRAHAGRAPQAKPRGAGEALAIAPGREKTSGNLRPKHRPALNRARMESSSSSRRMNSRLSKADSNCLSPGELLLAETVALHAKKRNSLNQTVYADRETLRFSTKLPANDLVAAFSLPETNPLHSKRRRILWENSSEPAGGLFNAHVFHIRSGNHAGVNHLLDLGNQPPQGFRHINNRGGNGLIPPYQVMAVDFRSLAVPVGAARDRGPAIFNSSQRFAKAS